MQAHTQLINAGTPTHHTSYLCLVGLSLGLAGQTAGHGVDLALAAWHAVEDVDVKVLLDDVPDLVVLPLLQVPLQELVGVPGDAQDKLAGAKIQHGLIAPHVFPLREAGQDAQVVTIVTLLVPIEPRLTRGTVSRYLRIFWNSSVLQINRVRRTLLKALTSQRKLWIHFRDCCRPVRGTCGRRVGKRPGKALLCGSPELIL